ncbi:hypothetical protein YTPLAS72_17380 [Nitrospira sp.]|nr:hypothetical protein YTPLAS72_17380 [Nitrospira sp.]
MLRADHVTGGYVVGAKTMTHLETVKEIYALFGEGRIEAILSKLSENVEWEYSNSSTSVPWLQPRKGRDNVVGFFQSLAAIDMKRFVPHTFLDGGQVVVVLLDVEFTVCATGHKSSKPTRSMSGDSMHKGSCHDSNTGLIPTAIN